MADKKAGGYDLEGARKAEISDEDSLQHLAQLHNYDLAGAREAGISDEDSLSHLAGLAAPKAEVYEKESPEFFGTLGAAAGAAGAAGDIVFSKGRQLFRTGEKIFGLEDPNAPKVKKRQFATPSEVAERAIGLRSDLPAGGASTATENYMKSGQYISPEGKPLYYGAGETGDYSGARKAAERAIETEKMFPGMKVLPGATPIALPQDVTTQVETQRAEQQRLKDIENQREVNRVAELRARRLAERGQLQDVEKRGKLFSGSQTVATKAGAPIIGGYQLGAQGTQAYNRLAREDLQASDIASGLTNVGGTALAGASLMPGGRYRLPKALGSIGLNYLADLLDVRNPRRSVLEENPPIPEKAQGGLVHLAKGKAVKKLSQVLTPHEGKTLLGTMADRTKATEGFMGGPGFINLYPEYTWAVDAPGAASRHMNIIQAAGGPERTVVAPMLMSKSAHRSNRPVFEAMYKQLLEDIKQGKVTPEQVAALNKRLSVEKTLPGAPDITSKEFLDYANAFHRRGTVADIMGQKRIGAVDLQKHLDETMDPALREAELGAIGPQLFTMESQMLKPDVHPGYKYVFTGEKGQDQFTPVPREFLFRDLESKAMKELGRPLSDYNYRTSVGVPTQLIDEKLLRSLEELGYKAGGAVQGYAKGKRVIQAARDLILPPAENAARTQIIGTLPTYVKAAELLKQRGAMGRGIDVGAGLGEGSKVLGKNFDTMEPYAKGWNPTYRSAEEMPSDAYGQLTNLNVLNVMPREARDELVEHIGRTMEPGGLGILTTRGADVMKAQGRPGPEDMSIITSRDTYQKGFTKQELEDYLRYMLGDKFDVNKLNLGPAGVMIEKKAEGGSTTPAWQRAEGKNPEGGLNAKGRASYNRETGGNLKAPQPEGGSRKKSFCARMGGMKKKLTSSKTANDPDSRINKALRKWKC